MTNVASGAAISEGVDPEGSVDPDVPDAAIPAVTLYTVYDESNVKNSKPLTADSELSLNDTIYVGFYWANLNDLTVDTSYSVYSIPEYFSLLGDNVDQVITDMGTNVARFVVGDDRNVHFTRLTSEAGYYAYACASCKLNEEAIESHKDEDGRVTLEIPGITGDVSFIVEDFKPSKPELKKEALKIGADGVATWTVKYTAAAGNYKGATPAALVDTLPKEMEYVGNASVDGAAVDEHTLKYDKEKHTLTWTVSEQAAKTTATLDASWGSTIKALTKEGTYIPGNRTIEWKVTVKPVSLNFAYLKVIDTMGKGLTLEDSSIKVNGVSAGSHYGKDPLDDGRTEMTLWLYGDPDTKAKTDNGEEITDTEDQRRNFDLKDGKYEITYTTKVSEDYFHHTSVSGAAISDADLQNNARLEWQWLYGGKGPGGNPPMSPTIEKGPGKLEGPSLTQNPLSKCGVGYDRQKHILTWNVTVNESGLNIDSANFEDKLANDGFMTDDGAKKYKLKLAYASKDALKQAIMEALSEQGVTGVTVSDVEFVQSESETNAAENRNIGFTCIFKGVKEKITFPVQAEVMDASFWAANHDNTDRKIEAKNTATLSEITLNASENFSGSLGTFTVQASIYPSSDMLKKAHEKFELSKDGGAEQNGYITWVLGAADKNTGCDVNGETATLTYRTKVNFDMQSGSEKAFLTKERIEFQNKAKLELSEHSTVTSEATSKASLKNTVLSKDMAQKPNENKVSYTVALNPYSISIAKSDKTELYLEDRMPAGLVLDQTTVKLYQANPIVLSERDPYSIRMDTGAEQSFKPDLTNCYMDTSSGETVLKIPVADKTPYVLKYDAYIVQTKVNLTNSIKVEGSELKGVGLSDNSANAWLDSFGGAGRRPTVPASNWVLEIKNTNASGAAIQIAGNGQTAKFGLYTAKDNNAKLLEATCDPNTGVCIFSLSKEMLGDHKLYLKELSTPDGYAPNSSWLELTDEQLAKLKSGSTNVDDRTVSLKFENEKTGNSGGGTSGGSGASGGGGGAGGGGTSGGGGNGGGSMIPGGGNTPADPEKSDSEKDPSDEKDDLKDDEDEKDQKDDKDDKDGKDKNNNKPKPTKKPSKDKNSGKTNGSGKSDKTGGSKGTGGSQSTSGSKSSSGTGKSGSGQGSGENVSNAKSGVQGGSETVDGAKQPAIPQTGQNWYGVLMLAALGVIVLLGAAVISPLCKEHEER